MRARMGLAMRMRMCIVGSIRWESDMRFQISMQGGGKYAVIDIRTRQVRYVGSLDGARQAQARLLASER
jgi:hypothetical protein